MCSLARHLGMSIFCLIGLAGSHAWSQQLAPGTLQARWDSSQILIGDQAHLELRLQADPSKVHIQWPQIPDSVNHLLVVHRGPLDTVSSPSGPLITQRITWTSFDSGTWVLPSFSYVVSRSGQANPPDTLQTDSLVLRVQTVPVDTAKAFMPIKDIIQVPFDIWDYWPYLAVAALVALGIGIFLYLRRRKKGKQDPVSAQPQVPPYQTALDALRNLEQQEVWKLDVKSYYSTLTDILRIYLEHQYHMPALEQTTDEVLNNLKEHTRLNQQRETLAHILHTADLAKFAKFSPAPEEHARCMEGARAFIDWTKPRDLPNPEATDSSAAHEKDSNSSSGSDKLDHA